MEITEHVPLAGLTTFKVGGTARYSAVCTRDADVEEAVRFAQTHALPYVVLGGGSNVLPADEGFSGLVIRMCSQGLTTEDTGDVVLVVVDAGYNWDLFVREVAQRNLWGMENMAGIPGTVGAAPVQNIGAYGGEVATHLAYVEVYNTNTHTFERLSKDACQFSYRESLFKHDHSRIIVRVAFLFPKDGAPNIGYSDLARAHEAGAILTTPAEIGDVVRVIRSKKFPDLAVYGTAGSFFKNPIISSEAYDALVARYGEIPQFSARNGIKIPLAHVLDKILNLRGFRIGPVGLFGSQPLVLFCEPGATAKEVDEFASLIEKKVYEATGITIEREVRSIES